MQIQKVLFILLFLSSTGLYAEPPNTGNGDGLKTASSKQPKATPNLDGLSQKPADMKTDLMGNYPDTCQAAINAVEEDCWNNSQVQNASAVISSARDKTTGLSGMLDGASEDSKVGAIGHVRAAKTCQAAIKSCFSGCGNVQTFLPKDVKDEKNNIITDNSGQRVSAYNQADKYCKKSSAKIGLLAENAVLMFNQSDELKALNKELKTGIDDRSFYEKHQTAVNVVGGGLIGLGAYKLGESQGEDAGREDAIKNLRYNCFKDGKWSSPECKGEYLSVCSENPKAEGCYAFTNSYCGISGNVTEAVGADTQFCDSMNAYRYCQKDGAANSPTCVEKRVQSGTCQADQAVDPSLECQIYNHQQLAQQVCQNYPNDPLCRRVLSTSSTYTNTAPATGATSSVQGTTAGNSGVMGYAMSASSNKVIPNSERKPSSNSDVSCAACSSVFSQISRVASEYCKSGQLYGCYKN